MNKQDEYKIRTEDQPFCCNCGEKGKLLYSELKDDIFGASGIWGFKKCPNDKCGLIWLDSMPLEIEIGKAYKTYYTHETYREQVEKSDSGTLRRFYDIIKTSYLSYRYSYEPTSTNGLTDIIGRLLYFSPSKRSYVDSSVFFLRAKPGGRLLEVGCGSGKTLSYLQKLGWQTEGVDFDPAAVHNARSKGLIVLLGSLDKQNYPDNHFDAVVMSHLIEHVHDPLRLVKESRRILKHGGKLVVLTPNSRSLGHKLFQQRWRGLEPPRHLYIFNRMSLSSVVMNAGFKRLDVSTTIHNANDILIASETHKADKNYIEGNPQPMYRRAWARCVQYIEWILLKFGFDLGEEIALIAEK